MPRAADGIPSPALAPHRQWLALAVLVLPVLLISMDNTILGLAVPSLSADLEPTSSQLLWIVDVYSFVVALALGKIIDKTLGFRVSEEEEIDGVDLNLHLETGYELTSTSAGPTRSAAAAAPARAESPQGA